VQRVQLTDPLGYRRQCRRYVDYARTGGREVRQIAGQLATERKDQPIGDQAR
jgi:hypothetical protein